MNARRNFLKKSCKTIAALSVAPGAVANTVFSIQQDKPITIGIIGAENSHSWGYGRMFNIEKKFPGVEVKYIWGETDEFAKIAMERGSIPKQVKNPSEMLGKIDALIVDHRHAKYHLESATPFVKAGIPTFIDKPFCYRAAEGKEFLQMAREVGTAVSSYSNQAYSAATFDLTKQVKNIDGINQVIRTGPVDLDSQYGGIFFYGVHTIQPLMFIFGEDIEQVRISRNGSFGNASLKFSSGLFATLVFKGKARGWDTFVETSNELLEVKPRVPESDPHIGYVDMVNMFRTGKEPRTHQSILNCVSVLEALEKSANNEKWTDVKYYTL